MNLISRLERVGKWSPFFIGFLILTCSLMVFNSQSWASSVTLSSTEPVISGSSQDKGFGYCGGMPSNGQTLSEVQKKKAMSLLHAKNIDSIKNNCMDCHTMVDLVSSMNGKDRKKWFKGIKYLREVINNMKSN